MEICTKLSHDIFSKLNTDTFERIDALREDKCSFKLYENVEFAHFYKQQYSNS